MTLDSLTIAEAPRVRLAGRDWPVPELAARQIMRLVPALSRLESFGRSSSGTIGEDQLRAIYDVAFIALTRAHPDLSRDAFDDLPIKIDEILAAAPLIARQAGLKPACELAAGDVAPGEV